MLNSAAAVMALSAVALYFSIRHTPDRTLQHIEQVLMSTDAH